MLSMPLIGLCPGWKSWIYSSRFFYEKQLVLGCRWFDFLFDHSFDFCDEDTACTEVFDVVYGFEDVSFVDDDVYRDFVVASDVHDGWAAEAGEDVFDGVEVVGGGVHHEVSFSFGGED